jgi:hypothetical protein
MKKMTDFHDTQYNHHATGGNPTFAIPNFLTSIILTWLGILTSAVKVTIV